MRTHLLYLKTNGIAGVVAQVEAQWIMVFVWMKSDHVFPYLVRQWFDNRLAQRLPWWSFNGFSAIVMCFSFNISFESVSFLKRLLEDLWLLLMTVVSLLYYLHKIYKAALPSPWISHVTLWIHLCLIFINSCFLCMRIKTLVSENHLTF